MRHHCNLTDSITITTLFMLASGQAIAFFQSDGESALTLNSIKIYIYTTWPLFFIILAIIRGNRRSIALASAWVSIVLGFAGQYLFFATHDPSRVLLLGIGIAGFWLCGFIALFSFSSFTSVFSGTRSN